MTNAPKPFQLLADDITTPGVIAHWIVQAYTAGASEETAERARVQRRAIVAWQEANPDLVKVPE